jgi:AcrR family transcriptional regulator
VALLGIIRRWHIREHIPLREIARRLGISRNTVRRYLRSETIEPAYAERRSTRAIDKYAFQLSTLLKTEATKSRKQRRTLKQIHEDLKELGFEGSYDRVAAFARTWREGQSERVNPASKRTQMLWIASCSLKHLKHSDARPSSSPLGFRALRSQCSKYTNGEGFWSESTTVWK